MHRWFQEAGLKRQGSASDPLWYKDAIIYELHVRAFADSNNDGIGDFPGLLTKLDYLQDLGVTCIWLLPFFPSPLRDDGYDISDYLSVNPSYGTVEDFKKFLNAAHDRDMQVMVELVINHTSDQHPWFQAARNAPAGSPERDYYVWTEDDSLYKEARIIFTDTEKSNWTWDPVAKAYYWHRFFSHQPDLNFDNPKVLEEVINVMRFWLDMGVDGLRMDAIPYLIERDGTNCENLPETHVAIKAIRKAIDDDYDGRLILAEANQWPEDVRPYFGDGDECHMAFHFPLMPRIYMALRQEDRLPITDIMAQTPDIPESCQWGIFLRNHDELTLEMVSDEERDYMYLAYSADPRMRINIGIRRRLAPLVDNNRRRIELLNSLLFSFPGTPILYYGDEIGMGDNIYLGDRNGVRTPMQWSGDRNAGFSRASPAKLFSPVIMDPVWGYEAINVEAQQSDPSSLLSWMRNMISLRKLFQVFGRGTLRFLAPDNRKVLAYIREDENQTILCVANLSRFAQPATLDLAEFEGMTPVEMLGYVEFPEITKAPYHVTLASYGFFWLELQPSPDRAAIQEAASPEGETHLSIRQQHDWESVFAAAGRLFEQRLLPDYMPRQRWFGAKSRTIATTTVTDWSPLATSATSSIALAVVEVRYTDQEVAAPDIYLVPLTMLFGEAATALREASPTAIIGTVLVPGLANGATGILADAMYTDEAANALLTLLAHGEELPMRNGALRGTASSVFTDLRGTGTLAPRRSSAEQSNTSIFYGDRLILKLFRRLQFGPNPDTEIGRFLTEVAPFRNIAPFGGSIEYSADGQEPATIAMLQGLVPNEGDGWQWTLEELQRFYEGRLASQYPLASLPKPGAAIDHDGPAMAQARDAAGYYLEAACTLGRRTAEMHLALAQQTSDPAFGSDTLSADDLRALQEELAAHGAHAFDTLRAALGKNTGEASESTIELAGLLLSRRRAILAKFAALSAFETAPVRIRVHGDYHLGQVLRSKGDFVILDFEGEPARSLAERRARQSPMKDVAGMLRSFSYAAYAALNRSTARRPQDYDQLEPWARLWEAAVSAEFLASYRKTTAGSPIVPSDDAGFTQLLDVYLLDKALYELVYELNNRPTWVRIPLSGILQLSRGPVAWGGQ
ncbi:maltose alpha-D-glucosyltransferase [Acidipila sp. EB88]|uniref:maltose alpha-D-glucosyltransferase n=1 Tax=Acidipila sp. EB88 TaxID=2305226 RepID=UPI000F5DB6BF|nr:maltose alpha-D-glucosyltransferase [Acidipila sp. EB88]RRA47333.1 maltose alpha-D-glucosyltransferase [Acidipila sp. EB88]